MAKLLPQYSDDFIDYKLDGVMIKSVAELDDSELHLVVDNAKRLGAKHVVVQHPAPNWHVTYSYKEYVQDYYDIYRDTKQEEK